jgi:hypothetical protein
MRSKALAVQSIPEMTEKRAQWCQLSGHSNTSHTRFLGSLLSKMFHRCERNFSCGCDMQRFRNDLRQRFAKLRGQQSPSTMFRKTIGKFAGEL